MKLIPEELSSSSALRAGVGQRGLKMPDVLSAVQEAVRGYPEDMELVIKLKIRGGGKFDLSTLGPTSTQLVRRYKREREGSYSLEEIEGIYSQSKELWDSRVRDPKDALGLIRGVLRSFKEGCE